jgi:hypothetical protein
MSMMMSFALGVVFGAVLMAAIIVSITDKNNRR